MTDKEKECAAMVEKSKEVTRETFKKFKVDDLAVTWTGGKDSTLGLWIIRQVCQEDGIKVPKVMTIDEFDSFDEIHDFINKYTKEWNLDIEWCRNDDVIKAAGGKLNSPVNVKAKQVGKPHSLHGFLPGSIFTISEPEIGITNLLLR